VLKRKVEAAFDGGRASSDGGALLLREANRAFGVTERLTERVTDFGIRPAASTPSRRSSPGR